MLLHEFFVILLGLPAVMLVELSAETLLWYFPVLFLSVGKVSGGWPVGCEGELTHPPSAR